MTNWHKQLPKDTHTIYSLNPSILFSYSLNFVRRTFTSFWLCEFGQIVQIFLPNCFFFVFFEALKNQKNMLFLWSAPFFSLPIAPCMELQWQDSIDSLLNVCKELFGLFWELVPATFYLFLLQHQHRHILVHDNPSYSNLLILKTDWFFDMILNLSSHSYAQENLLIRRIICSSIAN